MDIDVSSLTFRDASKEEKKRIFRILNLRSTIWLVLSIVGLKKSPQGKKGMAIAGLVCSVIAIVVVILWFLLFAAAATL